MGDMADFQLESGETEEAKEQRACPACGQDLVLTGSHTRGCPLAYPLCPIHEVPLRLRDSRFGLFLGCPQWPDCDITHGVHKKTLRPMGAPADRETRVLRMQAHRAFDALWRDRKVISRAEAYRWLGGWLDVPADDCHIAMFDATTCRKVLEAVKWWDECGPISGIT